MGFSRQEYWNGLPLPSPHKEQPSFNFMDAVTICSDFGAQENKVALLCLTLSDCMDCSLPGSSVHGIFQARVLEWGAIAFSARALEDFK